MTDIVENTCGNAAVKYLISYILIVNWKIDLQSTVDPGIITTIFITNVVLVPCTLASRLLCIESQFGLSVSSCFALVESLLVEGRFRIDLSLRNRRWDSNRGDKPCTFEATLAHDTSSKTN